MESHADKLMRLEEMARRAYETWRDESQPDWNALSAEAAGRWFQVVGAVVEASSLERVRTAAIAECASMLASSYPDHACTNAYASAIRSLSTSHAHSYDIACAGGVDALARHLLNDAAAISDGAWRICEAKSDMVTYARRAIAWFGANFIGGHAVRKEA
jgi:hypothetical protein